MDITLSIDGESCIRCGKCVRVCPSGIFRQEAPKGAIELQYIESCIGCGHCVAVCPTGSVRHNLFPPERVHPIDYAELPTPEQMMLLCKARRSNRAITKKPVPPEFLDQIVEAAHRAPTASNAQKISFTVVTDRERLRGIADFTIGVFDKVLKRIENPLLKPIVKLLVPGLYRYVPVFKRLKREHEAGNDPILRKATAVILIHSPKSNRFGCEDANLAYENGSLMAECLGVSQVYMGFVLSAIKQENEGSLAKSFGIDGRIYAIMALGMPAFRYPNYTDRKDVEVTKF
ncbi:MAG: nitroreductase family protein [Bacteroidales bacterium]|nr:nitroreductase family protein [Bacteroidales bacterium]